MEKTMNLRDKILKFLPKAASSAVTFKSPPISPVTGKGFPGGSIIPKDARRRLKNGSFDAREPASPIVSCVGQVKSRRKQPAGQKLPRDKPGLPGLKEPVPGLKEPVPGAKKGASSNLIMKLVFKKNKKMGGKSKDLNGKATPSLGHLKQFTSGGDVLANFDWRAHGAAVVPDGSEVTRPHSAPIDGTSGEEEIVLKPKKEINLWKRRTMVPPLPLQL